MHCISTLNNFTEFCPWAENNININQIPASCWTKSPWGSNLLQNFKVPQHFMQPKVLLPCYPKPPLVPVLNQINQVHALLSHLSDIQAPYNLAMKQCKIKFPTVVCQVFKGVCCWIQLRKWDSSPQSQWNDIF